MYTPSLHAVFKSKSATSIMFLICGVAYSCWAPMVPYVKSRLDLNEAELGMILLAFGIGALLSMPLTGWAVQRFGSRMITSIAAPGMLVFLPLLAVATSSFILSTLLFGFGFVGGAYNVSVNAHSVAVEAHIGKPILSRFHGLFSFGGLVGAGSMSFLLAFEIPLLHASMYLSLLMAVLSFCFCRHLLPAEADLRNVQERSFSWPQGRAFLYGAICFILFLAEGSMLDWGAVFLRTIHGYETSLAGLGYAIFSVAMAFGRFIGDRWIAKFGSTFVVRLGALLAASGIFLAIHLHGNYLELLGFFCIGLGASNIVPIMFGAAGRLTGTSAAVALTIVITMGYTGMLLGPTLIGWVAQATSLSLSLACIACLLVIVSLIAGRIVSAKDIKTVEV